MRYVKKGYETVCRCLTTQEYNAFQQSSTPTIGSTNLRYRPVSNILPYNTHTSIENRGR